jgi:hypothetical protein
VPAAHQIYAERVGPLVTAALSRTTGLLPWSVAETLLALGTMWCLWSVVRVRARARRRGLPPLRSLGRDALTAAVLALAVLVAFDVLWGVYYAQADLATRLGWRSLPAPAGGAAVELAALAARLVDATNADYVVVAGSQDLGRPTDAPPVPAIDAALERAYAQLALRLPVEPGLGVRRGRAKPFAASVLLSHLGISGFYFPWTGEANYNWMPPAASRPHVIAHEKAHQRGAASEDEAQFVGYLACATAGDPYLRYSGHLFAQREMLFQLLTVDRAAARALVARRHQGVQRDVDAERAFWDRYEGRAQRFSAAVNDTYLKAQGVEGGLESYRRGTQLLLYYARARGDIVAPP